MSLARKQFLDRAYYLLQTPLLPCAEPRTAGEKGVDCQSLKGEILANLDSLGAQYLAEHNVGHLYQAAPALKDFYKKRDPTNSLNLAISKTSRTKVWA